MPRVHFDTSEVDRLAVDLSRADGRLRTRTGQVLYVAANKIKKGMREDIREGLSRARSHLPDLPNRVSYDKTGAFEYEIGIDKQGQGRLGNIAAYGTSNNAPIFDHTSALKREVPVMLHKLGEAAEESVLGERE